MMIQPLSLQPVVFGARPVSRRALLGGLFGITLLGVTGCTVTITYLPKVTVTEDGKDREVSVSSTAPGKIFTECFPDAKSGETWPIRKLTDSEYLGAGYVMTPNGLKAVILYISAKDNTVKIVANKDKAEFNGPYGKVTASAERGPQFIDVKATGQGLQGYNGEPLSEIDNHFNP